MNIILPKKCVLKYDKRSYARVKQSQQLVISGLVNFKELMFDLTHMIRINTECIYCGEPLTKANLSLDHRYPLDLGGPTITNNLHKCCKDCNSEKNNYTHEQYQYYRNLREAHKSKYRDMIQGQQEEMRRRKGFDLPSQWLDTELVKSIMVPHIPDKYYQHMRYKETVSHYRKYGGLPTTIKVDRHNVCLDGLNAYLVAKDYGEEWVFVTRLENVVKLI